MLAPVRTVAPAEAPVSLDEAKAHCRVDFDDDNALIAALISAAVGHLDGWAGVLGRALVTQTWRQDYACFNPTGFRLPLGPAASITSIQYYDVAGIQQTLDAENYLLVADSLGPIVLPASSTSWPSTARRPDAVSVTYVAGTPAADVPAPIKAAILLLVGHWYANREAVAENTLAALPMAVDALIAPYRRVGI